MGRAFRFGARAIARTGGLRLLTMLGDRDCSLPVSSPLWEEMMRVWTSWFGRVDEFALYSPRQAERGGFAALLIREGHAIGFVKARHAYDFTGEKTLLEALAGARHFEVPTPLAMSETDGWTTLGMSAVGGAGHSPRLRSSPRAVIDEMSGRLDRVLSRRDDTPEHWLPMHGDLGPWNLRHVRRSRPAIFDLEHTGYGPPGADLVFHSAASSAMRIRGAEEVLEYAEAVDFWRSEIPRRFSGGATDRALADDMLAVLERWRD